jgi:hypothetical protein
MACGRWACKQFLGKSITSGGILRRRARVGLAILDNRRPDGAPAANGKRAKA